MPAPRFDVVETPLDGLLRVDRRRIVDQRGFFSRFFCVEELASVGFGSHIAQINHTLTCERGAVRGLHFQRSPHAEVKFVSCLRGEILDVAVDLRAGSPTFLTWHAEVLSAANGHSLLIPEGFAHGFQTLSDDCELLYLHSVSYEPGAEAALNALDPRLSIKWPLEIAEMSERDRTHPFIKDTFSGIQV